jgi:hypothetical protein
LILNGSLRRSDPHRDFFEINSRRVNPLKPYPAIPNATSYAFNYTKIEENFKYSEEPYYVIYSFITPVFPYWVHLDDIEIHLHTKMLIIKAVGSGNSFNRIIKPNFVKRYTPLNIQTERKNYDYLRRINIGSIR